MGSCTEEQKNCIESYDAVIVGAGFSGLYMLNSLRSNGLKVTCFEAGSDIGGVWHWNKYPGARVDTEFHMYQFTCPTLYEDFDYTERFPSGEEVLRYFHHMDSKLDLSRDVSFNTTVTAATFSNKQSKWLITFGKGSDEEQKVWAKYFIPCTGFASKLHIPNIPGLDKFRGESYHTSRWEWKDTAGLKSVAGKRIAVIGTGASGVQVIQELGHALNSEGQLTVYQRTPNLALPMKQCPLSANVSTFPKKSEFPEIYSKRQSTYAGIDYDSIPENAMDVGSEEREKVYETLFSKGGFPFWVGSYQDILFNKEANDTAYQFWAKKTRARITDERKKNILAPLTPPHAFGTKRPSLEQNYFEVFNKDNVHVVDVKADPILEITQDGITTERRGSRKFDVIIFATGFDGITGGLLNIRIENGSGKSIQEKWSDGVATNLGLTVSGFANMFFLYGPQAPTAFSNGPSCIEVQGEWLTRLILKMKKEGEKRVEASLRAETDWIQIVSGIWNSTLFPETGSWYDGSNIPGKRVQPLNFAGGIPAYAAALKQCEEDGYKGFVFE